MVILGKIQQQAKNPLLIGTVITLYSQSFPVAAVAFPVWRTKPVKSRAKVTQLQEFKDLNPSQVTPRGCFTAIQRFGEKHNHHQFRPPNPPGLSAKSWSELVLTSPLTDRNAKNLIDFSLWRMRRLITNKGFGRFEVFEGKQQQRFISTHLFSSQAWH